MNDPRQGLIGIAIERSALVLQRVDHHLGQLPATGAPGGHVAIAVAKDALLDPVAAQIKRRHQRVDRLRLVRVCQVDDELAHRVQKACRVRSNLVLVNDARQ
ncbi:hypothetical protein D3C71_1617260 [compost metagenome]